MKIDFVFVDRRSEQTNRIPFFCPVCDFVIRTYEDRTAFEEKECCYKCAIAFADSRLDQWKDGWRPSSEEIRSEVEKRSALPVSIDLSALRDS